MAGLTMRRAGALVRLTLVMLGALLVGATLRGDAGFAQGSSAPSTVGRAEAVTAAQGAPPRALDRSPYAALPQTGGSVSDSDLQYVIAGLGLVDLPVVSVHGGPASGPGDTATSTVTARNVNLFGGRVRAANIRVTARAGLLDGQVSVDGDAEIEGLTVDNVAYPAPAPSEAIPLPGIGTLVVREVQVTELGPGAASVAVRALHVVPDSTSGPLGTSELLVGAATAGAPDIVLSPPSVLAARQVSTLEPYVVIDSHVPSSFSNENFDDDDFDDDDFESDNQTTASSAGSLPSNAGSLASSAGSSGTPGGTTASGSVVVTVVVVVQTPTSERSPTAAPARTPTAAPERTPTRAPERSPTSAPEPTRQRGQR